MDEALHMKEHKEINETLNDHEARLKNIEKQNVETKYTLMDIQKGQADLKVMFMENQKSSKDSMEAFANKLLDTITNTIEANNENSSALVKGRLTRQEKIWALIITIINIGGSILIKVIK